MAKKSLKDLCTIRDALTDLQGQMLATISKEQIQQTLDETNIAITQYGEPKKEKVFLLTLSASIYSTLKVKAKDADEARELFENGDVNFEDIDAEDAMGSLLWECEEVKEGV